MTSRPPTQRATPGGGQWEGGHVLTKIQWLNAATQRLRVRNTVTGAVGNLNDWHRGKAVVFIRYGELAGNVWPVIRETWNQADTEPEV